MMEDLLDHQLKEDDLIFDVECFTDIDELIKPEDLLEWYSEDNHIVTNTNNLLMINTEQNNNFISETSVVNIQTHPYSTVTLPIVPCNSIRISFSDMFLNTLNSGDFQHVQDFFQTFMTRNCCFTSTQEFPSILQIPNQLIVKGPILYAHYLLGLNIMYPDMVLKVHNSRTIYDSKTKQTKVIMGVEYNLTKTLHIPYELWVPPEHLLNELHTARDVYHLTSLLQRSHISEQQQVYNTTTTSNTTTSNKSNKTHISTTTPPHATTTTGVMKETKRKRTAENHRGEKGLTKTSNSTRTKITTNTTNTSAGTITSTTSNSSHNTGSTSGSKHSTATSSTIYVPTNYITQVHDAAVVLPEPLRLTVVGQLEIVLDESQHVVSMNMRAFLA